MPKGKEYDLNTNNNGEERHLWSPANTMRCSHLTFIPVQLSRASWSATSTAWRSLGIYEVAPEDFALCEYVCTSKLAVQDIVRKGLDQMIEEFA